MKEYKQGRNNLEQPFCRETTPGFIKHLMTLSTVNDDTTVFTLRNTVLKLFHNFQIDEHSEKLCLLNVPFIFFNPVTDLLQIKPISWKYCSSCFFSKNVIFQPFVAPC